MLSCKAEPKMFPIICICCFCHDNKFEQKTQECMQKHRLENPCCSIWHLRLLLPEFVQIVMHVLQPVAVSENHSTWKVLPLLIVLLYMLMPSHNKTQLWT